MRGEDKMKRKFEDVLLKWKNDGMLKPMMVVGVRQIGKTYTIDRFCRDNFKKYIYINLLDRRDVVKLYKDRYAALSENYFRSVEPLLNSLKRQLEQLDIDYCLETISIDIYNSRLAEINNRICEIEKGAKK